MNLHEKAYSEKTFLLHEGIKISITSTKPEQLRKPQIMKSPNKNRDNFILNS
jgi:hypothetical protein